ncbi:MAG: hypothetical protein ACYCSN_19715 [Acidobacteriaceae bacterium]
MTASVNFNPIQTTNFPGTFFVSTNGFVQGVMEDDPVSRFYLRSGVVASAATVPMWGGVGIAEGLAGGSTGTADELNSILSAASSANGIDGFTVFNQAAAMVITNSSTVPLSGSLMAVNFFRFGSGARVAVQTTSTVASALAGGSTSPTLYWDPVNYQVTTVATSNVALPTSVKLTHVDVGNSKIVSYDSTSGYANWTEGGSTLVLVL